MKINLKRVARYAFAGACFIGGGQLILMGMAIVGRESK